MTAHLVPIGDSELDPGWTDYNEVPLALAGAD